MTVAYKAVCGDCSWNSQWSTDKETTHGKAESHEEQTGALHSPRIEQYDPGDDLDVETAKSLVLQGVYRDVTVEETCHCDTELVLTERERDGRLLLTCPACMSIVREVKP